MISPYSFEMLKVDKYYLHSVHENVKLKIKKEIAIHDVLVNEYSKFDDRFYLTINMRKNEHYFFRGKFCIFIQEDVKETPIIDFEIYFRICNEMDKIKDLKNKKKMKPLKIIKYENDRYIYYKLIATTYESINVENIKIPLEHCDICYNDETEKYENNPFDCCHNTFCVSCINTIKQTTAKICPMCRSL